VLPRPIAWVTTLGPTGTVKRRAVQLLQRLRRGPAARHVRRQQAAGRAHQGHLDQHRAQPGQFVVNLTDEPLARAMHESSGDFPPEVGEPGYIGLKVAPSVDIAPPRLADAPWAMECKTWQVIKRQGRPPARDRRGPALPHPRRAVGPPRRCACIWRKYQSDRPHVRPIVTTAAPTTESSSPRRQGPRRKPPPTDIGSLHRTFGDETTCIPCAPDGPLLPGGSLRRIIAASTRQAYRLDTLGVLHDVPDPIVFLFDVDNTLVDNDGIQQDLKDHIEQTYGPRRPRALFGGSWRICSRRSAIATISEPSSATAAKHPYDVEAAVDVRLSHGYPFADRLYPGALEVLSGCRALAYRDPVGRRTSSSSRARSSVPACPRPSMGRFLIYIHKEEALADIERRHPARHYVLVDDKLRILDAVKQVWKGPRDDGVPPARASMRTTRKC